MVPAATRAVTGGFASSNQLFERMIERWAS